MNNTYNNIFFKSPNSNRSKSKKKTSKHSYNEQTTRENIENTHNIPPRELIE